jgi:hypothetical protein
MAGSFMCAHCGRAFAQCEAALPRRCCCAALPAALQCTREAAPPALSRPRRASCRCRRSGLPRAALHAGACLHACAAHGRPPRLALSHYVNCVVQGWGAWGLGWRVR